LSLVLEPNQPALLELHEEVSEGLVDGFDALVVVRVGDDRRDFGDGVVAVAVVPDGCPDGVERVFALSARPEESI
jgi:hypothetical protein